MTRECWLVKKGTVVASAERASTRRERRRGLLGRTDLEGALVLDRTRCVHTVGMRFAIDVAHVDAAGTVLRVSHMPPNRVGAYVRSAAWVIEARAGAFERWGLHVGDELELRE
ncbi:MAG: hypothetical protein RLZ14_567 [Actinomycetota bacterium]|jgi:hypothetical protein